MPDWITLDWLITLGAMLVFTAFAALASHNSGKPYDVERPPRLPWRLLMLVSAFLAALCLVHMINLLGYETGVDKGLLGRR